MDNYLDDYLEDIAELCTDEVDEATVHKRWVYQRKRDKNGHPYGPSVKKAKWISSDPNYRVVIDPKTGNILSFVVEQFKGVFSFKGSQRVEIEFKNIIRIGEDVILIDYKV